MSKERAGQRTPYRFQKPPESPWPKASLQVQARALAEARSRTEAARKTFAKDQAPQRKRVSASTMKIAEYKSEAETAADNLRKLTVRKASADAFYREHIATIQKLRGHEAREC